MRTFVPVILAGAVLGVGGCASVPESDELVTAGDPRSLTYIGFGQRPVEVGFPAGELVIEGVASADLTARLTIRCPADSSHCRDRAARVDLVRHDDATGVRIAVENAPLLKTAGARFDLAVRMPAGSPLLVDMGYGDLAVRGVSGCITIDMNAGAVNVVAPLTSVASVWLDAGTGDATLITPAATIEGRRSWLVGAEVDWRAGPGSCRMHVDLNAGEIEVRLD